MNDLKNIFLKNTSPSDSKCKKARGVDITKYNNCNIKDIFANLSRFVSI